MRFFRWAQSVLTLLVLLVNVLFTQSGCILGALALLPPLLGCFPAPGEAHGAAAAVGIYVCVSVSVSVSVSV